MADTINDIDNSPEVLSTAALRRKMLKEFWFYFSVKPRRRHRALRLSPIGDRRRLCAVHRTAFSF